MKRYIKILVTIISVAILGSYSIVSDCHADRSLTMSPMSQKAILIPGEKYKGSFEISNGINNDENLNYKVNIGSYSVVKVDGGKDDYGDNTMNAATRTNQNIIMDWIKVLEPAGSLAPGEAKNITYIIDVPVDAPAGGQYASLLVGESREIGAENNGLNIAENMQMAFVIYAEVAGETIKTGEILENTIPSILLSPELATTSMVKNSGNVHTDAEYVLQIWPIFSDEEIYTNEEKPDTDLVLPDTERYHMQRHSLPLAGIFRAKQTVRIFGEESIVEKIIIVCPIWLVFTIIFIIAAIIIYLVMRTKSRKNSRKRIETE